MKIPSREIQEKVFGYYTDEQPPENSFKATAYKFLTNPLTTKEQIERLSQSWKRQSPALLNLVEDITRICS